MEPTPSSSEQRDPTWVATKKFAQSFATSMGIFMAIDYLIYGMLARDRSLGIWAKEYFSGRDSFWNVKLDTIISGLGATWEAAQAHSDTKKQNAAIRRAEVQAQHTSHEGRLHPLEQREIGH